MSNIICNPDFYDGCGTVLTDYLNPKCSGCKRNLIASNSEGESFYVGQIIYFNRKSTGSFIEKGILVKVNNDSRTDVIVRYFDSAFR